MTAAERLAEITGRIAEACRRAGRDPREVELLAVSKTFPPAAVRELAEAGQLLFGENRVQEAEPKIAALPARLRWHLVGHLQRNKVRRALPLFEAFHGVDSLRLARELADTAAELGLFPRIYLEVNVAGEETKFGFRPADLRAAWPELLEMPRLEIQGLMAIPPPAEDPRDARRWFVALQDLRDRLAQDGGVSLPGLSMGMSADFEVAVEEGSTLVRVGTALFGGRRRAEESDELAP